MAGPYGKDTITLDDQKKRAQKKIVRSKPGAKPVPLTKSDVKNAVETYLNNQLKLWTGLIETSQDAIHEADMKYQMIMQHDDTKDVMGVLLEVLVLGVATAVAPELLGASFVFKQLLREAELRKKAVDAIVDLTKESYKEVKKSVEDDESHEDKLNALKVSVSFFDQLYGRLGRFRNRAININVLLTNYIAGGISSNDPKLEPKLDDVLGTWYDAGLQIEQKISINTEQLSLIYLYDLMRSYCRQNVKLIAKPGVVSSSWELEGLNPKRRQAMYDAFEKIAWTDPRRPPIRKWDDLMNNWSFLHGE